MNLYILVPCFLLKNRLGHYVLAAVLTNLVVIVFLSVTQGLLFEVILPGIHQNAAKKKLTAKVRTKRQ